MAAIDYIIATPLMFAICTPLYSLILVTLLVLSLLLCAVADRTRGEARRRRAETAALLRRAQRQHTAALRGEPYGTYGDYMPARQFLAAQPPLP